MSRSGTKWLVRSLNLHPDVAGFGESRFFARTYVEPDQNGTYNQSQLDSVLSSLSARKLLTTIGDVPGCLDGFDHRIQKEIVAKISEEMRAPATPGDVFDRFASGIAERVGRSIPIDKTPQHVRHIDRILRFLPDSRFVILARDPYSFMLSYKFQGLRKSTKAKEAFDRRYHPVACSLVWRRYMQSIQDAVERFPDQTVLIRFEEIKYQPEDVLKRVSHFFELPRFELGEGLPPQNSSFREGERRELAPEDTYWMTRIAGSYAEKYGGGESKTEGVSWPVLKSVAEIPVWAVRNAFDLRKLTETSVLKFFVSWLRPR